MHPRFAVLGAAAAVADRHLRAIAHVGGELVAAADPAGVPASLLERFPHARTYERPEDLGADHAGRLDHVVVCTPNDLHARHTALGLGWGAHVLCEKPVALDPAELDRLADLEREHGRRVHTVLQLRQHPEVRRLATEADGARHTIELDYVLGRGPEFFASWHGREERSGGLVFEVGVHFLDLLLAIFGRERGLAVHQRDPRHVSGVLALERAEVRWRLSIDPADLTPAEREAAHPSRRRLEVDGRVYDLARGGGTVGLHTRLYEDILAGGGYGLADARPAIVLADRIRHAAPDPTASIPTEAVR